jgi:hypothetical protein
MVAYLAGTGDMEASPVDNDHLLVGLLRAHEGRKAQVRLAEVASPLLWFMASPVDHVVLVQDLAERCVHYLTSLATI